ncbi:GNAT family N-acetyltransferase [Lapillicoccus sp.]|uniref:GNAT family N-acetyltransferase n=1 Tax=Lapillicoccus sp. TaxID=1909287 RepID=UPI0025FE05E6|nr:GNAT family N-acetyltransferase [Lapillicoccus sp.]
MTVTVRQAVVDDLDAVLAVGHQTWPATYEPIAGADYVAMGLAKWWTADATLPALRAGRVFVAEVEGQVVGMASSGPLEGRLILWKLYVLPQFQGHGAGSALMSAVLERAAEAHDEIRLAYLDGNVQASGFYRRMGFVELGREVAGHGIPDSVWMSRALTPSPEEQS